MTGEGECAVCGEHVDLPYNCEYCNQSHCKEHRLPETHDCPGEFNGKRLLRNYIDRVSGGEVEADVRRRERPSQQSERQQSTRDLDAQVSVERRSVDVPEPIEAQTYGGATDPDYPSSPDVAVDGSIDDSSVTEPIRTERDDSGPVISGTILRRILLGGVAILLLIVLGLLL